MRCKGKIAVDDRKQLKEKNEEAAENHTEAKQTMTRFKSRARPFCLAPQTRPFSKSALCRALHSPVPLAFESFGEHENRSPLVMLHGL